MKQLATGVLYECSRLWGLIRQGVQLSTVVVREGWSRLVALLRQNDIDPSVFAGVILAVCLLFFARRIIGAARKKRGDVRSKPAIPESSDQKSQFLSGFQAAKATVEEVSVDPRPSPTKRRRSVPTMLGRVVFRNPHAEGRFGDWLTAQYYTRGQDRPYTKLKSKLPGERGIDGVYRRYALASSGTRYTSTYELLIVENKINRGVLKPGQLSVEWVKVRCDKMMEIGDRELLDTASAILHALSPETPHTLVRLLVTHNLVSGVSTRHHVDEYGNKGELQGEWENGYMVKKSLERKLEKLEVWLADKDA